MAEVELLGRYWRGDQSVDEDESTIILIEGVLIDGEPIYYKRATLSWEGRAPCADHRRLLEKNDHVISMDFLTIVLEGVPIDQFVRFELEDCIQGTTEDRLILPVARIHFRERVLS